jgi:hypothetical protein
MKCLALRHRHAPGGGGGAFEHEAGGRARLAQGVIAIADRFRPVGILVAILGIADRLLDRDPLPVSLQFIGRHHRQRGADARTHLRAVRDDDHRTGWLNAQVHTGGPW